MSGMLTSAGEVGVRASTGRPAPRASPRGKVLTRPNLPSARHHRHRRFGAFVPRGSTPRVEDWTVEDSASLYSLDAWGAPYFAADAETGRVVVRPLGDDADALGGVPPRSICSRSPAARARLASDGPLVVRFPDIACREAARLHAIFDEAAATWNYGAGSLRSVERGTDARATPTPTRRRLPSPPRVPRRVPGEVLPRRRAAPRARLLGAPRAFGLGGEQSRAPAGGGGHAFVLFFFKKT